MELPPDNPGVQVVGMGNSGGELFNKSCCYFYVAVEGFGRKGGGLMGGVSARLHRSEGLHLCEYDSTVWVNFSSLKFLM